jgi:hypothetical protein
VGEPLLVSSLDEGEVIAELVESLSEAGYVAVTKDSERCGDEALTVTISNAVLGGHKLHDGLRNGEADCFP